MGLDMYLERYPRYKNYGPDAIRNFEEWIEYKNDPEATKHSFYDWCHGDESILPNARDGKHLKKFLSTKYWYWDTEHHHPHERIYEQVAYWRKANAIHKWFVDHVQDGEDDCEYHKEVTKEDLETLLETCKEVLDNSVLVQGKIKNGFTFKDGKEVPHYEDGFKVVDTSVCKKLLPTQDGFFFGGKEYNQFYINDIQQTYEMISKVLKETDFDKQMLFYCSSW